jgi:transposase-like protein
MPWEVRAKAAIRSGAVPVKIGNDEDCRRRARTVDLHSRKSQPSSDDFLVRLKNED